MTQFYTYLHCKPDLTPFYVGKGSDGRKGKRCNSFSQRNQHHKNIVAKYGKENIQVIIFKKDSEASAFKSEIRLIKILRNAGFILANKTDGGEGISNPSLETRAKMSAAGRCKKFSDEHRAKIAASQTGRKISEETRKRLSESHLGQVSWNKGIQTSKETRIKLSVAGKQRKHSEETKAKMSSSQKGKPSARYGKKYPKIPAARYAKVLGKVKELTGETA
jgi:hypothetical protein